MAIAFIPANIFDYIDIPSPYPIAWGIGTTGVALQDSTRPISNNVLPTPDNAVIAWNFPLISPVAQGGAFLGQAAGVGYQVLVMEGTFTPGQVRQWSANAGAQPLGPVVVTQIVNVGALPYISLDQVSSGSYGIPTGLLLPGVRYTAVVRTLMFFTDALSTLAPGQSAPVLQTSNFYYSEWGSANLSVYQPPTVGSLSVNGASNPTRVRSTNPVQFGFTVFDNNVETVNYQVQIGTASGMGFSPTIWDSGLLSTPVAPPTTNVFAGYSGPPLPRGVKYFWRAGVQTPTGMAFSDATDSFQINSPPIVTSLKANGSEMIGGVVPQASSDGMVLSWTFSDLDGDSQAAYNVSVGQSGNDSLISGVVYSTASSITLPSLPVGQTISVSLAVSDQTEFGPAAIGAFITNAPPVVSNLLVDGYVNPGYASATPTLSWTFADADPGDSQQAYHIQATASTDPTFAAPVYDSGVVPSGNPQMTLPAVFSHGVLYIARVMVSDGISFSDWAPAFFAYNSAPGDPTLLTPTSAAYGNSISVTWLPASPLDPDGDVVTYTLELTSQSSSNKNWNFLAGPFPSGQTSFTVDASAIPAGDNYGIRIIASDGFAESNPLDGGTSPRFTIMNHAPTTPTFLSPIPGTTYNSIMKIELLEADPVDVDGDPTSYILELTRNAATPTPIWESLGVFQAGNPSIMQDASALPMGGAYRLRITAIDSKGAKGATNVSVLFSISNVVSVADLVRLDGVLYVGTTDGRVFKATDSIWQVEDDYDGSAQIPFEIFVEGTPSVTVLNGALQIQSPPGSTYILRHS